jgi:hypothetical protein
VHRRAAASFLTVLLTLAATATACAKPKDDAAGPDGKTDGTLTVDDGSTSTSGPGPSTTAKNGGTSTTARNGPTTTRGQGGGTTTTNPADTGAKGGAGAYARTLLRPQPATRIVIEIMQQADAAPTSHTLSHAVEVVQANAHKTVATSGPVSLSGGAADFSAAQLRSLADQNSKAAQTSTQAVVHLMFLHGTYNGDTSVLGLTVRGDLAVVFVDQVRSAASPIAPRSTIEDAVTEHELGHVLGLVDLVLHTGRQDPKHPGHSTNANSVMYWAVESDLVSQVLGGPPPVDFDSADRADLAAIRNGG